MVNCAQDRIAHKMLEVESELELVWGDYLQLQNEDTLIMAEVDIVVTDVMEKVFPDSMDDLNYEECKAEFNPDDSGSIRKDQLVPFFMRMLEMEEEDNLF